MSKQIKMFVSYSHKDESFHDEFIKHLKPMVLNGEVVIWSDKKLTLGEEVKPEIIKNLNESNIVIFLISVDFFCSDFIVNEEIKRALDKKSEKKVIPIILKHCDWKESPLGKYLAAPKDGVPIEMFSNRDKTWVEVIDLIKTSIREPNNEPVNSVLEKDLTSSEQGAHENAKKVLQEPGDSLNENFEIELNSSEVIFYHKNKDSLTLDDIFVYPDLKLLKEGDENLDKTINSEEIKDSFGKEKKVLIVGEEQSGKTTLAKMLFRQYYKGGFLPLLLFGEDIKNADLDKCFEDILKYQYKNLGLKKFNESSKPKILLIDDFSFTKLNKKNQKKFLEFTEKKISLILIFGDKLLHYDDYQYLLFSDYVHYEILPFGHLKRGELIEKWNSIGEEETIPEEKLHDLIDTSTRHINIVLRGNVVPPKPIYILTIIQSLDVNKDRDGLPPILWTL